jgi:hypothetical protein
MGACKASSGNHVIGVLMCAFPFWLSRLRGVFLLLMGGAEGAGARVLRPAA